MARFTLPRRPVPRKGSLAVLKELNSERAMLCVGGSSGKKFGFFNRAVDDLKNAGMEVEVFEGIEPDSFSDTVMRGAEAMIKFQSDWIVTTGGFPIDAAKAMRVKHESSETAFGDLAKVFGLPKLRIKDHFVAIPSTSDADVTACAVITDSETGIQDPMADFDTTPDIAKSAIADACTGSNPRQPNQAGMEKLLKCRYHDLEVDF